MAAALEFIWDQVGGEQGVGAVDFGQLEGWWLGFFDGFEPFVFEELIEVDR